MKIKIKNQEALEVKKILGENFFSTTFGKLDGEMLTVNNKNIEKIRFNNGEILELNKTI